MACNLKDYAEKSDDALRFIAKDVAAALACAKDLGNEEAQNKYADQINDACTILYRRKKYNPLYKELFHVQELYQEGLSA